MRGHDGLCMVNGVRMSGETWMDGSWTGRWISDETWMNRWVLDGSMDKQ